MDETKNISAGTARKIIAAVILAGVAAFAALNCLQPIIPAIGSAFGLRPAAASTIVGAGMLGIACALFILTFFAERLPRKRGICFGLLVCSLLTAALGNMPGVKKKFDWEFFSLSNKSLYGICFIAFSIMGSFVAIYNFIPFVLRAAPYNFSQSLIGLIFLVQIFG